MKIHAHTHTHIHVHTRCTSQNTAHTFTPHVLNLLTGTELGNYLHTRKQILYDTGKGRLKKKIMEFSIKGPDPPTEVEKLWQPGNLVARKFWKNKALAESFWILFLHFLTIMQFNENVKEMILASFRKWSFYYPYSYIIPNM